MVFVVRPPLELRRARFPRRRALQRMLREAPHESIGTIMDSDIEAVARTIRC